MRRRNTEPPQQLLAHHQQDDRCRALNFQHGEHADSHRFDQLFLRLHDLGQGAITRDGEVKIFTFLSKIGLYLDQKNRHAGDERQVTEKDRQVVNRRGAQGTQHTDAGERIGPKNELVDPCAGNEKKPGKNQAWVNMVPPQEIERHHQVPGVLANYQCQQGKKQTSLANDKTQQQARQAKIAQSQ